MKTSGPFYLRLQYDTFASSMDIKRLFIFLFAFLALTGIINCTLLEPAFAYKEDTAACASDNDSDCCFICCTMHHQWLSPAGASVYHRLVLSDNLLALPFTVQMDPPLGSIFHPPTAI
jgi:hypothetical protein